MKVTKIYNNDDGTLSFDGENLASIDQYYCADRCVGSIFEALSPGQLIEIGNRQCFEVDEDLDLIQDRNSWWELSDHQPGDLEEIEDGWIVRCRCSDEPGSIPSRSYMARY